MAALSNFHRDPQTSVIVNTDDSEYEAIKRQRALKKQTKDIWTEMDLLKKEIHELRAMITKVIVGN